MALAQAVWEPGQLRLTARAPGTSTSVGFPAPAWFSNYNSLSLSGCTYTSQNTPFIPSFLPSTIVHWVLVTCLAMPYTLEEGAENQGATLTIRLQERGQCRLVLRSPAVLRSHDIFIGREAFPGPERSIQGHSTTMQSSPHPSATHSVPPGRFTQGTSSTFSQTPKKEVGSEEVQRCEIRQNKNPLSEGWGMPKQPQEDPARLLNAERSPHVVPEVMPTGRASKAALRPRPAL